MIFDTGPLNELTHSLKLCLKDDFQLVEFSEWAEILLFMRENIALKLDRVTFTEQNSARFESLTDWKLALRLPSDWRGFRIEAE